MSDLAISPLELVRSHTFCDVAGEHENDELEKLLKKNATLVENNAALKVQIDELEVDYDSVQGIGREMEEKLKRANLENASLRDENASLLAKNLELINLKREISKKEGKTSGVLKGFLKGYQTIYGLVTKGKEGADGETLSSPSSLSTADAQKIKDDLYQKIINACVEIFPEISLEERGMNFAPEEVSSIEELSFFKFSCLMATYTVENLDLTSCTSLLGGNSASNEEAGSDSTPSLNPYGPSSTVKGATGRKNVDRLKKLFECGQP